MSTSLFAFGGGKDMPFAARHLGLGGTNLPPKPNFSASHGRHRLCRATAEGDIHFPGCRCCHIEFKCSSVRRACRVPEAVGCILQGACCSFCKRLKHLSMAVGLPRHNSATSCHSITGHSNHPHQHQPVRQTLSCLTHSSSTF